MLFVLIGLCFWSSLVRAQSLNTTDSSSTQCPINVPGFIHHGNCNLLCRPAAWTDILVFFLGNYIAHAATVSSIPGQSVVTTMLNIVAALMYPGSGVRNGIRAISSLAKFAPTDLQVAARAGALCAVVRVGEKPPEEPVASLHDNNADVNPPDAPAAAEKLPIVAKQERLVAEGSADEPATDNRSVRNNNTSLEPARGKLFDPVLQPLQPKLRPVRILATKIHGLCQLPDVYELVVVPTTATFVGDSEDCVTAVPFHRRLWQSILAPFKVDPAPKTAICCSYNIIKIIIALTQFLFATSTLYRTRGDQLNIYGYAAFGLTVASYASMSFINLIGNAMCPQYNSMFIVESTAFDEFQVRLSLATAEERERFMVTGTIGRLTDLADAELRQQFHRGNELLETSSNFGLFRSEFKAPSYVLGYLFGAIPVAIIGGLSRFQQGQSALYQRVWTMTWLVFGFFAGPVVGVFIDDIEPRPILDSATRMHRKFVLWYNCFAIIAFYAAPAIGGYVVVAQMISDFGVCFELSE